VKFSNVLSLALLALIIFAAACAQKATTSSETAVSAAQASPTPTQQAQNDNRTVKAQPVIEGDPDTPPANTKDGFERITIQQLKAKMDANEDIIIMDVDGSYAWNARSKKIKGAIRVDPENIDAGIKNLPKDKEVVTYCTCEKEATSGSIAKQLMAKGFKKVSALVGGFRAWDDEVFPVEPKNP